MNFLEVLRRRRSVRAFTGQDVDNAATRVILEAARQAPSAGDLQAFGMVVVQDRAVLRSLADAAAGQSFVGSGQLAIVFLADPAPVRATLP